MKNIRVYMKKIGQLSYLELTLKIADAHIHREKPCELNYRAQNERASVVSAAARTG